ncbi:MAG: rhomboid family intramembrane serine protease [Anaeromyxobacter sp.]
MLLPIGLDEAHVSRLPWVSIAIVAICAVVFFGMPGASDESRLEEQYEETRQYWAEHPYLEPPPALERRFGLDAEDRAALAEPYQHRRPGPDAAAEQARLDALAADLEETHDAMPVRRWSLVPARGLSQPGWITALFLHADLFHLLGNMLLFFLVVGPFLEDAWGRLFFTGFYLAGGIVAGAAQALPMGDSPTAILGASGAIAACLGAFALRFAHRRVRIAYWFFFFIRGTFFAPAWLYAGVMFVLDLVGLAGGQAGIAYGAHVGGFLFGLGVAIVLRATGLEARLTPAGAVGVGRSLAGSRAAEALHHGDLYAARREFEAQLARRPDDPEALAGLLELGGVGVDRDESSRLLERLVVGLLGAGDAAGARAALLRHGPSVSAASWRPATALRAGELLADAEPVIADRFDETAERGEGALGAKALLRRAERARAADPARALGYARLALERTGVPLELAARARQLVAELAPREEREVQLPDVRPSTGPARTEPSGPGRTELPAPPPAPVTARPAAPHEATLGPAEPVKVVPCELRGVEGGALRLVTGSGRPADVAAARVAALAAGLVAEVAGAGGQRLSNRVVLDLLCHRREGERGRVLIRLLGHALPLAALHPGVPPQEAFGRVVDGLLAQSGARAAPSPDAAAGRPLARFPDLGTFEAAVWGRRLS